MSSVRPLTRNDVSLNTGGPDEPKEYYDQICALSAATINKNFELLFQQRPEIKELVYDNGDASIGMLKATVKAPQILIEPNQTTLSDPEMYYSLIIDKGKIYYPGSPTVNIDGWVITVVAKINRMIASPHDKMSEDERFPAQDALYELQKTHEIPESDPTKPIKMRAGEYSIHRLFAAISETAWTLPNPEKSLVPLGPKDMTLAEWEKLSPQNHTMAAKVKATLQSWASDHEYSAFFTLGLEVSVPNPAEAPLMPTFVPTGLRLQNYPFIDDSDYVNFKKAGDTPKGIIDNPWNCLVWCETCDGRELPVKATLPYTGNLAMPARTPGVDKDVFGTFVLDGRLFFDDYLLPELQAFCLASQVIPLSPLMYTNEKSSGVGACISWPVIACGPVPSDLPERERQALPFIPPDSSTDKYYAFKRTGTYSWEWHKKLEAPGSGSKVHYYGDKDPPGQPVYRKYTTESEMWVKIERKPNMSILVVTGRNVYKHWEGYFNNDHFSWKSQAGPNVVLWGKFAITSTWSVDINLSPEGVTSQSGIISPVIERLNTKEMKPEDMVVRVTDEAYNISNSHGDMKSDIYKCMSRTLALTTETLRKRFESAGRFFYPGTGTLQFEGPQLSDQGHVYCNVNYKPPEAGRIKLHIPNANFPYGVEHKIDSSKREIAGTPPSSGNIPLIKWTPGIEYDSAKQWAKLTLVAEGSAKKTSAFSYVRVIMSQVRSLDGYGLFSEEMWESKEEVLKRQEEERRRREEEKKRKEEEKRKKLEEERRRKEDAAKKKKEEEAKKKREEEAKKKRLEEQKRRKEEEARKKKKQADAKKKKSGTKDGEDDKMNTDTEVKPKEQTDKMTGVELGDETKEDAGDAPSSDPNPNEQPITGPDGKPDSKPTLDSDPTPEIGADSDPEPEPKPEEPPAQTWSLNYQGITNSYVKGLYVKPEVVGQDHVIQFSVLPDGAFPAKRKPRFLFQEDAGVSKFTLELEGHIRKAGKYVLQLNESWSDPIMTNNPTKTEIANLWYAVQLDEGVKVGKFTPITQAEAEEIQGVKK